MNVKDRLKSYIKHIGLQYNAFEESIDASNGYINSISKGIGVDKLQLIIEKYPNLNIKWLLTGNGAMINNLNYVPQKSNSPLNETNDSYKKIKGVPYYDVDFTASFLEIENNQSIRPDSYISHPFFKGCDYVVRASGQSMAKVISHGDAIGLIKIEKWREFFPFGEIYAIVTNDGFRMVKIITKGMTDDTFTLISKPTDSKRDEFPPQQISKSSIVSIFKVQASSHLF